MDQPTLQELLGMQAETLTKQKTYADSLRDRRANYSQFAEQVKPRFDNSQGQVDPNTNFNLLDALFKAGQGYVEPVANAEKQTADLLQQLIGNVSSVEKSKSGSSTFDEIKKIQDLRKNAVDQGLSTKMYDTALKEYGIETAKGSDEPSNKSKALEMVNNLIGGNYQAISGGFKTPDWLSRMGVVSGAGDAKAAWTGLSDLLAMAKRGELKGSGTISDFEVKMLQKAALAGLDPSVQTEKEFLAGLKKLQKDLESGGAVDNRQGEMVVMTSPDGKTYQVDASEVNEAKKNGWK